MSAFSWLSICAVMGLVVATIYTVLFSVGSGLGPKQAGTVHPISGKPTPKEEAHPVRHAA